MNGFEKFGAQSVKFQRNKKKEEGNLHVGLKTWTFEQRRERR